jgi:predicted ribosomally synthesized peptide with nif11-like leader
MKTLEEFIQRLEDDAAFEKQAQSFNHGDDLMAFVKREGYDFTLEQLMREFAPEEKLPAETTDMAPAPADISASTPPRPDEAEFPRKPEALSNPARGMALPKRGNDDFTREPLRERLPQPKQALPPPGPEKVPPGGFFRGGGGRHRGFSPQRLRSISEEDS